MKLRSADIRRCTGVTVQAAPPPPPSLHPSPGSQPQAPLSMPGISHISLREYPLEKAAFLTGHVSGYRSIKICDIDVEMTWLAVSGYIKGSTLVIIIALVWVSGLQPRGEMWVFKMKTSFLCRKYSNTSCFLTVLQLVWFLPCHPIWVRIMQQAREKGKPGAERASLGLATHSMIPTFIFWEQKESGVFKCSADILVTDSAACMSHIHEHWSYSLWFLLST